MYEIETSDSLSDVQNGCLKPSDGGKYKKETALSLLENGNGGTMSNGKNNLVVSHIPSENDWIRKKLRIK